MQEAEIKLTVEAATPRGAWTMRVVNDGPVPVRIVADARLLSLVVTPRGAQKGTRCELPPDMRPGDDLGRNLIIPPKRSYVETFEPRYYCFSGNALRALAPTSIVTATLGWRGGGAAAPHVLAPVDGIAPVIAPRESIDAPPIALPDDIFSPAVADVGSEAPHLKLEGPEAVEAESADEIPVPISLRNAGSGTELVRLRPDMVGFDVTSGSISEHCPWQTLPGAPTRDLFTRLPPGGTASLTLALAAYCSGQVLDQQGLLVVRPWLDTTSSHAESIGLTAFAGHVAAPAPTYVRLHRGRQAPALTPPQLAVP